jgi:ABC-type branched-subunit amino acid transport system substrate-binding protein
MRVRVIAMVLSVALFSGRALAGDDLVIGMSAAFKGTSRGLGIELYRGAQAQFEEVNRAGGINGRKIVLKAYDDGYDPGPAVENTIHLVEKDDVLLLFGYVGTPTTTRVLPLLKRYESRDVCLFFPFTGAEPLRRPPYAQFVFNLRASYARETAELVDHFVAIGRKRIAVFFQIDAYGRSGWEGVRSALAKHKLELTGEATYRRGVAFKQSMNPQVEILRRGDPDAIISIGSYGACAAFVRDARDAGWDVPIANVSFVGSENLLTLLVSAGNVRNKDYTKNLINSQVVPSYNDLALPAVGEYRNAMRRIDPKPPAEYPQADYQPQEFSFVSLEGYLDAKLLTAILRKTEAPVTRTGIKKAAESLENYDLGIGVPISFGPGQHQGLNKVYFTRVRDGRFVPLADEEWKEWRK